MFCNAILLALFNAYYLFKMQYNKYIGGVLMAFQLKQNRKESENKVFYGCRHGLAGKISA